MTNGRISFLTKAGVQTFTTPIEGGAGFWGSVGASSFVFDPEVIYDTISNRFFAMASEGNAPPGGNKSYALIAVSDDSDPNGPWHKYRLETTALAGSVFDSPNIAVDSNAVYVTGDGSNGNYQIFIWDKASMVIGLTPAVSKSLNYTTSIQSRARSRLVPRPDQCGAHRTQGSGEQHEGEADRDQDAAHDAHARDDGSHRRDLPAPEDPPQKGSGVAMDTFDAPLLERRVSQRIVVGRASRRLGARARALV
jgi:hypothetical protein